VLLAVFSMLLLSMLASVSVATVMVVFLFRGPGPQTLPEEARFMEAIGMTNFSVIIALPLNPIVRRDVAFTRVVPQPLYAPVSRIVAYSLMRALKHRVLAAPCGLNLQPISRRPFPSAPWLAQVMRRSRVAEDAPTPSTKPPLLLAHLLTWAATRT